MMVMRGTGRPPLFVFLCFLHYDRDRASCVPNMALLPHLSIPRLWGAFRRRFCSALPSPRALLVSGTALVSLGEKGGRCVPGVGF
jgi:hypothetical protein